MTIHSLHRSTHVETVNRYPASTKRSSFVVIFFFDSSLRNLQSQAAVGGIENGQSPRNAWIIMTFKCSSGSKQLTEYSEGSSGAGSSPEAFDLCSGW